MIRLPEPWPVNPWPTSFRTVRASEPTHLPPGLRFVTVQSPSLGGRGDLAVHVPAVFDPTTVSAVPVVVLLHGVYGSFWNWSLNGDAHCVLDELIASGDVAPMVLAMPSDGMAGEGTAYLPTRSAAFDRWIVDDVPNVVREMVPCCDDRSPVVLGGNSMGGFGALRLGVLRPDVVSAVVAHSAVTDLDDLAAFTVDDVGRAAGVPADRRSVAETIADAVEARGARGLPALMLDCGTDDPLLATSRALRDRLVELGVPHDYEEYEGGHDWTSWRRRVGAGFRFADREVGRGIERRDGRGCG